MKYLVLIFLLTLAWQVEASVLINEVMYDPIGTDSNHEWIELVNTSTEPIDITGWKLFEANSNHGLAVTRGSFLLQPNEFVVIADNGPQFILDYPDYSGSVLDSVFSLNNTGETFELRNTALESQDSLAYSSTIGASENGATLTRTSGGSWIEGVATPGAINNETPYSGGGGDGQNTGSGSGGSSSGSGGGSGGGTTTGGGSSSGNSTGGAKKPKVEDFKPYYRISLNKDKNVVTVATPVVLDIVVEYVEPNKVSRIKSGITYVSFGDGTKTLLPKITPITHEWQRAGTYTVVVTYKSSELFKKPSVVLKQVVKVLDPAIVLSIDDLNNIVITNSGNDVLDISNWFITQGVHDTQMPAETYIEKNSSFTLSNNVVVYEGGSLELLTSSGVSVIDYVPENIRPIETSGYEKVKTEAEIKPARLTPVQNPISDNSIPLNQNKGRTFDWSAFVLLVGFIITYCVSRFVMLGSFISFSFVEISESVEILEERSEGTLFS